LLTLLGHLKETLSKECERRIHKGEIILKGNTENVNIQQESETLSAGWGF
jgi:hypothetical protein